MTSQQIKVALLKHNLFDRNCLMATTEFRQMDVFTMTKNYYTDEYEVKVNISDLRNELACIQKIKGIEIKRSISVIKHYKHKHYLDIKQIASAYHVIPNRFYFCIPWEYVEETLKVLENTPYGVISFIEYNNNIIFNYDKDAKNLHNNKFIKPESLLRKLSTENYFIRKKLLGIS